MTKGSRMSCDYPDLPPWLQDNNYLLTGYRPPLNSFRACFESIFYIHTETVNIWTHLIGCVMFILLAINFYMKPLSFQDKLVFAPFFLGAILCLCLSFLYHTLSCHSAPIEQLFQRLDYCGITSLILGSFIPWLYYGFYCRFWLRIFYLSFVVLLGACTIAISLLKRFGSTDYRPVRSFIFSMFGLSGTIPAIHIMYLQGWSKSISFGAPLIFTGILYIAGTALYTARLPERIFPGKCDIWFQSHQIFHVLVVLATLIDYLGLRSIANNYHNLC